MQDLKSKLTIGYCTRKFDEDFKNHIIESSGLRDKDIQVITYVNNGEGLTTPYNKILEEANSDIVILCHDDIIFKTKNWGNKILKHFKRNPNYGILGVAGTKSLSETGRWWDNRNHMRGIVEHQQGEKVWESKYSTNIGNKIDDVVLVDGLFLCINKKNIKLSFNKLIKGYHFYDVDFCINNFKEGVEIGVIYDIRLIHKSIGQTNEEWEENRVKLVETYSNILPLEKKEDFKNRKMKVLVSCLNFNNYTGSELYNYELVKGLVENNCEVTICSNVGNPLAKKVKILGVSLYPLNEPPHFKLGDGNWGFNTKDGPQKSTKGALYPISEHKFDVIHVSHKPVMEHMLQLYPNANFITSIHSEVIDLENPIDDDRIKKYIAIRPEIEDYIKNEFHIPEEKIELVYNPIDSKRFNEKNNLNKVTNNILFVGTIDYLRKDTLLDLIKYCNEESKTLTIVGKENSVTIKEILNDISLEGLDTSIVKYFNATDKVETFLKECDETAGIQLGRTTIESWLSGKKSWIYNVDSKGKILEKNLMDIPEDIDKFKSENVINEIIKIYKEIV